MTQEQKDLLINDLCGRLAHGVKCKMLETNEVKILVLSNMMVRIHLFDFWEDDQKIQYGHQLYLSEFKPYLLPISSMTEEQDKEFMNTQIGYPSVDWFDKNHFDYRGLIPMGLAEDATGLNIY